MVAILRRRLAAAFACALDSVLIPQFLRGACKIQERELERQREVLELVYLLRQIGDEEVRNAFISGAAVATVRPPCPSVLTLPSWLNRVLRRFSAVAAARQ